MIRESLYHLGYVMMCNQSTYDGKKHICNMPQWKSTISKSNTVFILTPLRE